MGEDIPDFIGSSLVGQDKLKNKLNFQIYHQNKTGFLPFIMFHASRGSGKTTAARALCRNLKNKDGSKRRGIEINGVSLQNVAKLMDEIIIPKVANGQEITLFIDEVAECNDKVIAFLLSILQPDASNVSSIEYQGNIFDFDFRNFNVVCATTNGEKLREAFKSRFKKIEIEPYSHYTLKQILFKCSDSIQYLDGVEDKIVEICRDSPREVVLFSKDILQYVSDKEDNTFGRDDWLYFEKFFDIKPMGLTVQEIELLKYLYTGPKTLTAIAAKLCLDTSTVRREIESFLISKNLIFIDIKRKITKRGSDILRKLGY